MHQLGLFDCFLPKAQPQITSFQPSTAGTEIKFRVYGSGTTEMTQLYFIDGIESRIASSPGIKTLADGKTEYSVTWDSAADGFTHLDSASLYLDTL